MFFLGKWKSRGAARLTRTLLVAGLLVSGPMPQVNSAEDLNEPAASKTKDRASRRAENRARKEREKSKDDDTETSDFDDSKPTLPVRGKRTDSTQVAIKTSDAALKPGAMTEEELNHPLAPVIKLVNDSQSKLASVKDYSATFLKKEVVNGKALEQSMAIKVREKPFSVALKFNNPYRGRQVIYVDGQNNGKMLVKPEGFKAIVGTLSIDPNGDQALAENRHPITQVGISSMIRLVQAQLKSELKHDDIHEINITETKTLGLSCVKIQVKRTKQLPGIPFAMTSLYLSKETKLPVRIENYAWPTSSGKAPQLVEDYTYQDLKINVGLGDQDFR